MSQMKLQFVYINLTIWNKLNLSYFITHCVLYWLIHIPKRISFDPDLKQGTFD